MNIEHTKSKIRKEKMRLKKLPASIQLNTEPLYAIIMSRKSFRVNLRCIFCLNVKELLTESIRKNQVIHKSFTNMPKLWLLYKANIRSKSILKVNSLLSAYVTETQRCLAILGTSVT